MVTLKIGKQFIKSTKIYKYIKSLIQKICDSARFEKLSLILSQQIILYVTNHFNKKAKTPQSSESKVVKPPRKKATKRSAATTPVTNTKRAKPAKPSKTTKIKNPSKVSEPAKATRGAKRRLQLEQNSAVKQPTKKKPRYAEDVFAVSTLSADDAAANRQKFDLMFPSDSD